MHYFCQLMISLFFLGIGLPVKGQDIRINEIMSSNARTLADEEGDFSDWIELYNAGKETIQLEGWGLSDNTGNPFKWIFPKKTVYPGQYLLVWASGKNLRPAEGEMVNGFYREVWSNIPGTSIEALTKNSAYPGSPSSRMLLKNFFEAPADEGNNYGQRMQALLKAPASGQYTFWISSDDNGQLWLSSDDSPGNIRLIAQVNAWTNSREWSKYPEQQSLPVTLEKGKLYYITALAKEGTGGDNLAVGWQLPDGTLELPMPAQHLFWQGGELHTGFSISAEGEEIILTSPDGTRKEIIEAIPLASDHSYGRKPDGSSNYVFFTAPTPGKANSTPGYTEILTPPVFSRPGGFYSDPFELMLSSSQPGVTILYTLDGSLPDPGRQSGVTYPYKNQYRKDPGTSAGPFLYRSYKTTAYTNPLFISNRSDEANQVSRISTTFDSSPWYTPANPVDKAVVIKARAVKEGAVVSEVVSHTYFIRNGGKNPYPLPVFSFSAGEDALFDYSKGIYIAGVDFETWRSANPNAKADGGVPANYHRDGDESEQPAHLEYFDHAGTRVLGQNVGFRLHGAWSRAHPMKTIRIYARNEYGKSTLDQPFFKDRDMDSYKRIILRNSGNDFWNTMFRDAAMQSMVSHMDFETQAYQPSVLFLNGEYWGIHNIRERVDKYYISAKFGVNEDQLDILEDHMIIVEGDSRDYAEILEYLTLRGVRQKSDYDYILTKIDISSFTDYIIAELFMVNTDWPGNNIKYWRRQSPEYLPAAGKGRDGRWRWILFDTDFAFGIYTNDDYTRNMMNFATRTDGPSWPNPPWSTFLFSKLLENEDFKNGFIIRFTDQLNTAFQPAVVRSMINGMQSVIEPEMSRHIQRWKIPSGLSAWYTNTEVMKTFADRRPGYARSHLRQFFGLSADYQLTMNVSDPSHGHVVVNTIPLLGTTRGVSANPYPWQGTYFRNMPLRLEAIPSPGYEFVRWEQGLSTYSEPVLELKPAINQYLKAVFKKSDRTEQLVHYWNFNKPDSLLVTTYTLLYAGVRTEITPGSSGEVTDDDGEGFQAANARFQDPAGTHLRVNNPLGIALTFRCPSSGFSQLKFSYETRRSGQGAGTQVVEYTLNGTDFTEFRQLYVNDDTPQSVTIDFSKSAGVNDNPDFAIRIRFLQGDGGNAGNNRIDNVTLEGIPSVPVHVRQIAVATPDPETLEGNVFPNPFVSKTTLQLNLQKSEPVQVSLYDLSGRKVMETNCGDQPSGVFLYGFNGSTLQPGIYMLVCRTGSGTFRQRLVKYEK